MPQSSRLSKLRRIGKDKQMTGSDFGKFGDDKFWKIVAALCITGAASVIGAVGFGVYWLIKHVTIQ